jgi:hypothetical protein
MQTGYILAQLGRPQACSSFPLPAETTSPSLSLITNPQLPIAALGINYASQFNTNGKKQSSRPFLKKKNYHLPSIVKIELLLIKYI